MRKCAKIKYVMVYDEEPIVTLEDLFVSSGYYGLEELCNSINERLVLTVGLEE